jgi:hypothetical protein
MSPPASSPPPGGYVSFPRALWPPQKGEGGLRWRGGVAEKDDKDEGREGKVLDAEKCRPEALAGAGS